MFMLPVLLLLQPVTSALALGWSCYAGSLSSPEPEASLVDLALRAVAMLEQCSKAAAEAAAKGTAPDTSDNIGACLSGQRAPALWHGRFSDLLRGHWMLTRVHDTVHVCGRYVLKSKAVLTH